MPYCLKANLNLAFHQGFAKNSILPFLAEDYEKLVVVDLRQLNVSGDRLLEMFSPTDILILYNSAQFAQDKEFEIKCN